MISIGRRTFAYDRDLDLSLREMVRREDFMGHHGMVYVIWFGRFVYMKEPKVRHWS